MRAAAIATALVLALAGPTAAEPVAVEPGDPERKPLLDTVRPAAELALGGAIEFVVSELKTLDGWAYFRGNMQRPGGERIVCERTRMADECGYMDGMSVFALLTTEGERWRLVDMHIAPTDASWTAWPDQHDAPCTLILLESACDGQ